MKKELYIANLGKYNEGELLGEWITLPFDEYELEELYVNIKLGTYDNDGNFQYGYEENGIVYEKYAIHDYSNMPFTVNEFDDIEDINDNIKRLKEATYYIEEEQAEAILEYYGWDEGIDILESENYRIYDNCHYMEDVAEQLIDDLGMDNITNKEWYFDTESYKRDLEYDGYWSEMEREYEEENGLEEDSYEMEEDDKDYHIDMLLEDGCISESTMERYFDYEKFGNDLEIERTFIEGNGFYIEIL